MLRCCCNEVVVFCVLLHLSISWTSIYSMLYFISRWIHYCNILKWRMIWIKVMVSVTAEWGKKAARTWITDLMHNLVGTLGDTYQTRPHGDAGFQNARQLNCSRWIVRGGFKICYTVYELLLSVSISVKALTGYSGAEMVNGLVIVKQWTGNVALCVCVSLYWFLMVLVIRDRVFDCLRFVLFGINCSDAKQKANLYEATVLLLEHNSLDLLKSAHLKFCPWGMWIWPLTPVTRLKVLTLQLHPKMVSLGSQWPLTLSNYPCWSGRLCQSWRTFDKTDKTIGLWLPKRSPAQSYEKKTDL